MIGPIRQIRVGFHHYYFPFSKCKDTSFYFGERLLFCMDETIEDSILYYQNPYGLNGVIPLGVN